MGLYSDALSRNMHVYVHMCVCVCTYACVHVCTYIHMCIYIYIYACIYTYRERSIGSYIYKIIIYITHFKIVCTKPVRISINPLGKHMQSASRQRGTTKHCGEEGHRILLAGTFGFGIWALGTVQLSPAALRVSVLIAYVCIYIYVTGLNDRFFEGL